MHIPDGYLSPSTCAVLGAAMVPVWAVAVRRVKQLARSRSAPLLAVGAAYCFLVMMFNVPIPDGTTAHARRGGADSHPARALGRRDRGQRGARAPGAVLRRRRRARVRRQLLQHGVRDAVRRLRRLCPADRAARRSPIAARVVRGRARRLRRPQRRRAVGGDRVRPAAGPLPHRRRHAAVRAVPPLADDPGDGHRPPHGRRLRGVRAHRGRRGLPAARAAAAAAHQPSGRARTRAPRSPRCPAGAGRSTACSR